MTNLLLGKNLALGASAVQSSTYNSIGMAHEAVDGKRPTNYKHTCSHTAIQNNPWWRVDLMKVYHITRITITSGEEQISGAEIHIGNGRTNNGNSNQLAATVWSIPSGGTVSFNFTPIEGQYVNIFLPGMHRALSLCEVEVFAGNLALGARAVQSSIIFGFNAQNAVDGNRDTAVIHGSCSLTQPGRPSWWRVDLKKVHKIRKVTITDHKHNNQNAGIEDIEGSLIRIGNSLENNGNNNPLAAVIRNIPIAGTKTFEFAPIYGRYVNIVGKDPHLCVCEVEVFCW
uniref:Fucolectin tachylectin-4 pentraxin-1 domain-containing protein n=1 Tax=Sinocyclocheilus rhinocerous TaxID=307959 RepID=A0A673MC86_9TELE